MIAVVKDTATPDQLDHFVSWIHGKGLDAHVSKGYNATIVDAFRAGFVYVEDCYAGTLSETEDGYRFAYDADYLSSENPRAVSLTLPLRDEPYDSSTLFSFFDGLIPEGWLLNVVTRNWKLNRKDRFGLLLVACRDTIGNVTIQEVRK